MNTKTTFFFCFLCALLLIYTMLTQPSKHATIAVEGIPVAMIIRVDVSRGRRAAERNLGRRNGSEGRTLRAFGLVLAFSFVKTVRY
ncbi:hypothetical protein LR48_Vigan03g125800 [Vigna angularis]|uniref:Uncharacterized protein n=1 Tax=Phaseolus angularis TaxID=3914 RepID=A0A0L9U515_PHAAN|nr:hypothetical protein LR48_Vigan03g125800 [Vigna angularis]